MSEFAVTIERIGGVFPIEGADRIESVTVGDFQSITMKGQFVKPMAEEVRDDSRGGLGRIVLKSVSEEYLLRKAKKGEEITEYA